MPKLYITEFPRIGYSNLGGTPLSLTPLADATTQVITFSTTTQSAALSASTTIVRVVSDTNCYVTAGSNPTATSNDLRLVADIAEYFSVTPGHKLAVSSS